MGAVGGVGRGAGRGVYAGDRNQMTMKALRTPTELVPWVRKPTRSIVAEIRIGGSGLFSCLGRDGWRAPVRRLRRRALRPSPPPHWRERLAQLRLDQLDQAAERDIALE